MDIFLAFLEAEKSKFKAISGSLSDERFLYIIERGVVSSYMVELEGQRKGGNMVLTWQKGRGE